MVVWYQLPIYHGAWACEEGCHSPWCMRGAAGAPVSGKSLLVRRLELNKERTKKDVWIGCH